MAAVQDGLDRRRVVIGGMAGHVEGRPEAGRRQQVQDAPESPGRAVTSLGQHGQPAGVLGILAEPGRLGVDIEGQRDGDPGAAGPGRQAGWCLPGRKTGWYLHDGDATGSPPEALPGFRLVAAEWPR